MPSRAWVVTIAELADKMTRNVSMPSRAWVVTWYWGTIYNSVEFQCPHGLELLPDLADSAFDVNSFNALTGLSCYTTSRSGPWRFLCFNALTGLSCYLFSQFLINIGYDVSMPSRAWVVTARMSNILNFLWYFLCIPAIYKCILAYLSIFFNQLSEFLRCESPSTFLGTCLSHHSFIWW